MQDVVVYIFRTAPNAKRRPGLGVGGLVKKTAVTLAKALPTMAANAAMKTLADNIKATVHRFHRNIVLFTVICMPIRTYPCTGFCRTIA